MNKYVFLIINVVLINALVKAPRPVAETDKVTLTAASLFKTDDLLTSNWRPMSRATTGGRP